ncbi:NAD-dependent epimerase/dehydratase family protein [Bacteroidota bacterium]
MLKIFVSGADGFVGSNLLRELLSRNYSIVAFVQSGIDPHTIKNLDIDISYGDLLLPETIDLAMKDCDIVIHTAAITSIWPYRSDIQKNVNIKGTKNIIEAAKKHKIKRFIHIGTANSFGFGSKENPGDENQPYMAGKYKMDYMDTKYEAHKLVLDEVKNNSFPAIIVNPAFMFGPFPSKFGSATMIESIYKQKVPGYTKGGRNYIAVKDVCVAIANAVVQGVIGECYLLANKNLNYKEAFTLIAEVAGVKPPGIYLPAPIVLLYSRLLTFLAKIGKYQPSVNYQMARMSLEGHYYTSKKAVSDLNLPQTSVKKAIEEAFVWMKDNQVL